MPWIIALVAVPLLTPTTSDVPCPPCQEAPGRSFEARTTREQEIESTLRLGGALRYNLQFKNWVRGNPELPRNVDLDFEFDTFRLNADGAYGDLSFSAEYRFYAGYHMVHHGSIGYALSDRIGVQAGVHRVPFGPLPYASHNWFFQLPYYLGLEDDYDAGIKLVYDSDRWSAQAAFYKNDEGAYTGESLASARYSYDVVPTTVGELGYAGLEEDRFNEEINQLNGRLVHRRPFLDEGVAELGVSGQWGQLYNSRTDGLGTRWATGLHLDATHDRWNLIAQALRYEHHPENPVGTDSRFIVMGAYDAPYKVASEANLYLAGLAYSLPVAWGPITTVQVYEDFTYMQKTETGFDDSLQSVLGTAITAGPLLVYIDLASGKNHPWLGPDYGSALAEGSSEAEWNTRFNLNIGYYF